MSWNTCRPIFLEIVIPAFSRFRRCRETTERSWDKFFAIVVTSQTPKDTNFLIISMRVGSVSAFKKAVSSTSIIVFEIELSSVFWIFLVIMCVYMHTHAHIASGFYASIPVLYTRIFKPPFEIANSEDSKSNLVDCANALSEVIIPTRHPENSFFIFSPNFL